MFAQHCEVTVMERARVVHRAIGIGNAIHEVGPETTAKRMGFCKLPRPFPDQDSPIRRIVLLVGFNRADPRRPFIRGHPIHETADDRGQEQEQKLTPGAQKQTGAHDGNGDHAGAGEGANRGDEEHRDRDRGKDRPQLLRANDQGILAEPEPEGDQRSRDRSDRTAFREYVLVYPKKAKGLLVPAPGE